MMGRATYFIKYVAVIPVLCCLLVYILIFHTSSFSPLDKTQNYQNLALDHVINHTDYQTKKSRGFAKITESPPPPSVEGPKAEDIARVRARELPQKDKLILLDLLRVFVETAEAHNWTYFLHGGSLIGSVRHGGFIPWDDDVDVLVNEKHTSELKQAFKKTQSKYIVHDRGNDPILKLFSNESSYICLGKDCKWKWPFLDVCFFAENDSHIWENHPFFAKKKHKKVDVFPLHSRPFENMMVNAPTHSLKWIQISYGDVSDNCQTWSYKHTTERGGYDTTKLPCKYLKDIYPFVLRRWVNGTMEETVKIGDKVLRVKLVDELKWTVTKPYSLEPVSGMHD